MTKPSGVERAYKIKAYEKSVVLNGSAVLHPLPDKQTAMDFAQIIAKVMADAEHNAFERGRSQAQADMRVALGIPEHALRFKV